MQPLTDAQIAEYDRRFKAGAVLWFWTIHHSEIVQPLSKPLSHRIDYIKTEKPEHEHATRLRALQPVKGPLPEACGEAGRAYDEAWRACDKPWGAYDKARRAYDETLHVAYPELLAQLRSEYPDHPWDDATKRLKFPEAAQV